jgi:hypothetical protein
MDKDKMIIKGSHGNRDVLDEFYDPPALML